MGFRDQCFNLPPPDTTDGSTLAFCFSSENTVQLSNGTIKRFDQLEIGNEVLVHDDNKKKKTDNKYEPIYSFGHYHPTREADFIQLLPSRVEVSSSHLVMLQQHGGD